LNATMSRRKKLSTMVLDRIVDVMLPDTASKHMILDTDDGRSKQAERTKNREWVNQKVLHWRANGKPCSELVARFRLGILFLLPTGLSDEK
jgi:hypothetical protein